MDFPSNANKDKQAQKNAVTERKVNKVVKGGVKTRKKGTGLAGTIISGDARDIKSSLARDVIVPAVKNLIEDLGVKGVRMLVRGEAGSRRDSRDRSNAQFISYDKMSDRRDIRSDRRPARLSSRYDEIVLEDRGDAEEVLFMMKSDLGTYGLVSIANLYDLIGISSEYTDHKYGWTNLDTARVIPVRGGYAFDLPRAVALN